MDCSGVVSAHKRTGYHLVLGLLYVLPLLLVVATKLAFCLLIAVSLCSLASYPGLVCPWILEKSKAQRRKVFKLSPSACLAQCASSCFYVSFPQLLCLPGVQALSTPKQRMASGGSKKGATCG